MATRSITAIVSVVALLAGCQMHNDGTSPSRTPREQPQENSVSVDQETGTFTDDQQCSERVKQADLLLEFQSWAAVTVRDKSGQTRSLQDGSLEELLGKAFASVRSPATNLVVVVVPNTTIFDPAEPLAEEIMRRIDGEARQRGCARVEFQSVRQGFRYAVYPNGLPTQAEIDKRREMLQRIHATHPQAK